MTTATVGASTETSTYDGDGVRFSRQVDAGPVTRYVTDLASSLPVTIDDGSRKYVWGIGLAYAVSGSAIEVYHTDRLGSVRAITDAAGTVTATYRTDEFGIETASTGTSTQPYGFTGEPEDASGLSYLRARYYDPVLGRFTSRDTWAGSGASPRSLNQYAYMANNPLSATDPSGHWLNIVVGAAIGGIAGFLGSVGTDIISGQPPDLGRAAVAAGGGAITGGVCGATLGIACLAAGAVTSVVQYQTTPGATNPVDDPVPYVFNAAVGATLGRYTGGQIFKTPAVRIQRNPRPQCHRALRVQQPRLGGSVPGLAVQVPVRGGWPRPRDIPAGSAIGGGQQQPQAERDTVVAAVLTLAGLLTYALFWFDSSAVPYPGGPGEWRSAPAWCRRLLRYGNGPVLIAAVSVQAAAAITAIFGILRWIGVLENPLSAVGAWIVAISWCISLGVWGLITLRARRWRR